MPEITFADITFNAADTPVSGRFDDIYFSAQDGLAESEYVFQDGNRLWQKWQSHPRAAFVIAETGFGTGLNFLAAAEKFERFRAEFPHGKLQRLYFISFEKYPLTAAQLASVHKSYPQFAKNSQKMTACWQPRQHGCQRYHFGEVYLDLWFGDIADNLPQLGDLYRGKIDAWFLDGFSPEKNPEMWNEALYRQMFRLSRNGGSFATFTAAGAVRRGLQAAGFEVQKRKGFGKKREMLFGKKPPESAKPRVEYPYFYAESHVDANDVAIIGGGVAALFAALSLLEKGKTVTLYCKDDALAMNASGNLQGAVYPQLSDDDERNVRFYRHSFDYALQRLAGLSQQFEFEHDFSGMVLYGYNDKTAQKLTKIAERIDDESLFKRCTAAEIGEKLGLPVPNGGAFIPQGGWLSPVQLVRNGFAWLEKKGLKIVLNHKVENLTLINGKWQWQSNGDLFRHQTVVLANGHRLNAFCQTNGIPLYPVRGLVSRIPTTEALQKLKCVLCYDGYLTPMSKAGSHCIGASHIRDNADESFSLTEHQDNIAKFQQNMTACSWTQGVDFSANLAKVGIRAALRDRLPIVGAVPDFERQKVQYAHLYNRLRRKQAVENGEFFANLYLINGLASRGLTTAPLLGELLAAVICDEPLPLEQDLWHALSPNRSWIRKLLKGSRV